MDLCGSEHAVSSAKGIAARFPQILEILDDEIKCKSFQAFLAAEFSAENLLFYKDVQKYRDDPSQWEAIRMYNRYVDIQAPLCINVSYEARERARVKVERDNNRDDTITYNSPGSP